MALVTSSYISLSQRSYCRVVFLTSSVGRQRRGCGRTVAGVLLKTAQRSHITPHRCTGPSVEESFPLAAGEQEEEDAADPWMGLYADALVMAWLRGLAQDTAAAYQHLTFCLPPPSMSSLRRRAIFCRSICKQ